MPSRGLYPGKKSADTIVRPRIRLSHAKRRGPMVGHQAASSGAATGLKVAIVGGSIAGCAAAIALQRGGCEVTVYERSRGKLEDRGAGIGMPLALLHTLIERDFVDANMAHFQATRSPFILRTSGEAEGQHRGRLLWEQPIAAAVTNWASSTCTYGAGSRRRSTTKAWRSPLSRAGQRCRVRAPRRWSYGTV